MRLLVSWLRDFVDVTVSPSELGDTLSMRGFELAGLETVDGEAVVDLEITANRPDCFGVLGLAREVATTYDLPRRTYVRNADDPLRLAPLETGSEERAQVVLEDESRCPRYAAALAEVTVGPSPSWLAARLTAAGIRPINNVVDVTNYVLLELGQPMHAFDLAKLAGPEIRIRGARAGEQLETLDGVTRVLDTDMLVIADAERPQAIAGVMGGADAEVSTGTTRILLESATFDPRSVRGTSRRIGLKTEAAMRFERGTDIEAPVVGLERACALLEAIGAGRAIGPVIDCYPTPARVRDVPLRRARIPRVLGQRVDDADVERILRGLDFGLTSTPDGWRVTVPSFRVDVAREADLLEEVARHYGYDRLPTTFPELRSPPPSADPRLARERDLRRLLVAAGFSEAVTFSFIDEGGAARFAEGVTPTAIAHPLSEKFSTLRPSLLPGLLGALAHNRHRERRDVQLFELGRRFRGGDGERRAVGLVWSGAGTPPHWSGQARDVDFFDMKGVVDALCGQVGASPHIERATVSFLVPGRTGALHVEGTRVGMLGQLAPAVAEALDLPSHDAVYVAEIDLDALAAFTGADAPATRVAPLPRFPSAVRDLSLVIDDALPAATVRATIRRAAPDTLVDVREFDRYQGKGIPPNRVSVSWRLTFRAADRTLTDNEVQRAMGEVLDAVTREHHATQR